jgi:hypothetical protein
MNEWRMVATVVLWCLTLALVFVFVALAWGGDGVRVDPCTTNAERCSAWYGGLTPGQRWELAGEPVQESQDRIFRFDDEVAPRGDAFEADWEEGD